jgi:hypothetical protein
VRVRWSRGAASSCLVVEGGLTEPFRRHGALLFILKQRNALPMHRNGSHPTHRQRRQRRGSGAAMGGGGARHSPDAAHGADGRTQREAPHALRLSGSSSARDLHHRAAWRSRCEEPRESSRCNPTLSYRSPTSTSELAGRSPLGSGSPRGRVVSCCGRGRCVPREGRSSMCDRRMVSLYVFSAAQQTTPRRVDRLLL